MTEAASHQAVEEGKRRLREFLEASDTGRQAMAMSGNQYADGYEMSSGSGFNKDSRRRQTKDEDNDDEDDDL